MGKLGRRIERLKLTRFIESLERVFPEIDIPNRLPAKVRCLLPDHPDKTPSFSLREHRWHCFGCGRGGDIVDFAQHYYDVPLDEAVRICEGAFGYGQEADADLRALLVLADSRDNDAGPMTKLEWERALNSIADGVHDRMLPYTRCDDPLVQDLTWHKLEYVYDELRSESLHEPPRTVRLAREEIRALRTWAMGWCAGIESDVAHMLGKDRLDVSAQGPLAHA